MRNKFVSYCYRCGSKVEPGAGHFERLGDRQLNKLGEHVRGKKWICQHAECAIKYHGTDHVFVRKSLSDDFSEVK